MSDVVIRAEGLGKKYLIGHQSERESYTTLRDVVGRTATGLARSAGDIIRGRPLITGDEIEEFWALRDVNFEVKRGDVVGIIGRNGAGKSTLLKILSRITDPSEGRVNIRGRVASLLEVGTGFHPELTGRENIFLNGAILGMTRSEIKKKFDEIVAFAEVEKFLDTPVKRYSSGMYVRLAFAVAAHLEPEILIVDEVLAVGDAEFQKKCLGKMSEVARQGRTVLFVSHNASAIGTFCHRAIWLRSGAVEIDGDVHSVLNRYMTAQSNRIDATTSSGGQTGLSLISVSVVGDPGHAQVRSGTQCGLLIRLHCAHSLEAISLEIGIRDDGDAKVSSLNSALAGKRFDFEEGEHEVVCSIKELPLSPGLYYINVAASKGKQVICGVSHAAMLKVGPPHGYDGEHHPKYGPLLLKQEWRRQAQHLMLKC